MIVPAILEDSPEAVIDQLENLRHLEPPPEVVEIDIIDGEFFRNLTIDTEQLSMLVTEPFQVDVHLMTLDPTDFVYQIRQGSERGQEIRAVIAQVERLHSFQEYVEEVQANHFQVGFALDLHTPVEAIDEQWWPDIQVVSVMGAQAGQQGLKFHPVVLEKVKELVELRKTANLEFEIRMDIGMNPETIALAKQHGADSFAVGSQLKSLRGSAQQEKWEDLWAAERG